MLGLALTSTDVSWALLAGYRATDDAILDDDAFTVDSCDELVQRGVAAARGAQAIAASSGHEVRSVAVTADDDTVAAAGKLIETLKSAGFDDVRIVPATLIADSALSGAHSAALAVVTDTVPIVAVPRSLACGRPPKWLSVGRASAAAVVIGVFATGALFFAGDAGRASGRANPTTAGSPEIVTAAVPRLTPPTIAVHPRDVQPAKHLAKMSGRPAVAAPVTPWTPPAVVPAKPVTATAPPVDVLRREMNPPAPEAVPATPPAEASISADSAHLPQNLIGPVTPGPADALTPGAPAPAVSQASPAPAVSQASPEVAGEVPAAPTQPPAPQAPPPPADPLNLFSGLP